MSAEFELLLRAALAETREPGPRRIADFPDDPLEVVTADFLSALRPAAVLTPVLARPEGWSVLLTRRADHLRTHSGQVSFPGGRRDAVDRDSIDTALREAWEEVGLHRDQVEVLGFLDDYLTFTQFRITPVVGLIHDAPDWVVDPGEVAEAFEVPLSVVLDAASYRRETFHRDGIDVPFWRLDYHHHNIWGATAGMLRNLCGKVEALR